MSTPKRNPLPPLPPETPRRATYQDVLDAPPLLIAEILDGTLYTHRRLPPLQNLARSHLGFGLAGAFDRGRDGPGGWWIALAPEMHLGEDVLVPDIAGWRHETVPELPEVHWNVAPDWACQVLSPATRRLDIGKRAAYAREGVRHLWLVDAKARSLEVFELRDGCWASLATLFEDAEVCQPPFDAITFPLDALWLPEQVVHEVRRPPRDEAAAAISKALAKTSPSG